jgi:hypothetical protein
MSRSITTQRHRRTADNQIINTQIRRQDFVVRSWQYTVGIADLPTRNRATCVFSTSGLAKSQINTQDWRREMKRPVNVIVD